MNVIEIIASAKDCNIECAIDILNQLELHDYRIVFDSRATTATPPPIDEVARTFLRKMDLPAFGPSIDHPANPMIEKAALLGLKVGLSRSLKVKEVRKINLY